MRVLVTGAAGYIGRHVVDMLVKRGVDVIAADINLEGVNEKATHINANILESQKDIFEELGRPDVLIHMAWRNGFVHNDMSHIEDLSKHYMFIRNMIDGGLKHITVMGSMHEVGYYEGAIDENTPCNPRSLYAIAKNSLRQMVSVLAEEKGICFQWIRGFYIIGDDLRSNSIFAKILLAAEAGKKEFPFTTGESKYDFISIDGLAYQIAAVATQEDVNGIINCCSGTAISLGERVEQFISDNGLDIKLMYGAFPKRTYDSPAIWGDNKKITEIVKNNP